MKRYRKEKIIRVMLSHRGDTVGWLFNARSGRGCRTLWLDMVRWRLWFRCSRQFDDLSRSHLLLLGSIARSFAWKYQLAICVQLLHRLGQMLQTFLIFT